jgi:hypothetical protein
MNIQLIALKQKAADLFTKLEAERTRLKGQIEELDSPASRKKYVGTFVDEQIKAARLKAKETASRYQAEVKAVEASIAKVQSAWSTTALMARAKPYNDDADVNTRLLVELEQARVTRNIERARPSELIDLLNTAVETGNLVELNLLKTEIGRREFSDSIERMKVRTGLDDALAGVKIEGQAAAFEAIAQATSTLEAAADVAYELDTGREAMRAKALRIGAEYAAREQQKAETA